MRCLGSCITLLLFVAVAGVCLQAIPQMDVWSNGGQHPVPLKSNIDSSGCSDCHDVAKGKHVHTAVLTGCTTCHRVQNKNGATRVTLVSPTTQLCFSCHPIAQATILHGPYKVGECVVCHSPHASDYPAHTWVSHQDICLGCHTRERLKVDDQRKVVTVPWGVSLTLDQMKGWQYLNLNATLTANHPVEGHPVSGPNTANRSKASSITCLSCHNPHASNFPNLLPRTPPEPNMPLCKTCSLCADCHSASSSDQR